MNKEQLAEQYTEGKSSSSVFKEAHKRDFLAGYEAGQPKWISVDEQTPEDDRAVLVKTKDYRRPQYEVTDVQIGYLENEVWYYNEGGEINSGLGWHLTHWMEIPK